VRRQRPSEEANDSRLWRRPAACRMTSRSRRLLDALFGQPSREPPANWYRWLCVLLLLSAVPRLAAALLATPLWYPDSNGYRAMARMLAHGDVSGYDAVRTLGYPVFMVLLASNLDAVRIAQMVLGLVTTAMVFWVALRLTGVSAAAFIAGALYGLNIMQIQFENTILSESLAGLPEIVGVFGPRRRRFPCSERFRRHQSRKTCRHTIP